MNLKEKDDEVFDLNRLSLQAKNCKKFETGSCRYCDDCSYQGPNGPFDCVGGFTPQAIAIIIRYSELIEALEKGLAPTSVDLGKHRNPWLSESVKRFGDLDALSAQAEICAKQKREGSCDGCPLQKEEWCIGSSFARNPIRIFAEYARKIKELKNKEKKEKKT